MSIKEICDIYDNVTRSVKQIGMLGYKTFTASVLSKVYDVNINIIVDMLNQLVDKKCIEKIYRIYNPKDISMYVDFKDITDIPKDGYIYYPPTGDEFYVSKYDKVAIFYSFTNKRFDALNASRKKYEKELNQKGLSSEISKLINILNHRDFGCNITNFNNILEEGVRMSDNSTTINNKGVFNNKGKIGNQNSSKISINIDNKLNDLSDKLKDTNYSKNVKDAKENFKSGKFSEAIKCLKSIPQKIKGVGSVASAISSIITLLGLFV